VRKALLNVEVDDEVECDDVAIVDIGGLLIELSVVVVVVVVLVVVNAKRWRDLP